MGLFSILSIDKRRHLVKLLSYGLIGVIGTLIHFSILVLLVELFHLEPVLSSSIGFIVTVIVSFYLNRRFTFRTKSSNTTVTFIKYTVVSCSGFILNSAIMYCSVHILSLHYSIAQVIVVVLLPISNFLLNNYWTFRESKEGLEA
jgi:putative flippase GtrA